ncbi:phytoene/squalene synthase family protein [Amycolatopsis sp. NPDC051071]|uniref:phytoene/squalene synthase family protein n=1 Tax=Amycolatopsis sp. NPDC051071 TaxID=3154637 RepID=UPI00342BB4B1
MTMIDARILDAAGIADPWLRECYARCRVLHARHGRTYYLATRLLPPWKRPYVHALYGFARHADEIVDNCDPGQRAQLFDQWSATAVGVLAAGPGPGTDRVSCALAHTLRTWDIPVTHVEAFLSSMRMDLVRDTYPTYTDLSKYMYGSAAVIGLQMTPILQPLTDEAYPRAEALGVAFQLTNFIRDIGEDLRRGRVYLPQEDLDRCGVSRSDLAAERCTPGVHDLIGFEIARTRAIYAYAIPGIEMLHPSSRPCIDTAARLYAGILDAVENADHEVLQHRVRVGIPRRIAVALPAYLRSRRRAARPAGITADRPSEPR